MSLWTDIQGAIREGVLAAGSNSQVIYHYPDAPKPALPYTAIEFVSFGSVVNDWFTVETSTGKSRQYGTRDLTVRLHWFGQDAYIEGALCASGFEKTTVRDKMRLDGKISLLRTEEVVLTSEIVENSYLPKAEMNLVFSVALMHGQTDDEVGYFDQVDPILWTNKP